MKRKLALIGILFLILVSATICVSITVFANNEAENVEIVVNYVHGVINNKQYDLIEKVIHPDEFLFRVFHLPNFHEGLPHTHSQHRSFVKAIHEGTPDLTVTIKDIAADGLFLLMSPTKEHCQKNMVHLLQEILILGIRYSSFELKKGRLLICS